MEKVTAQQVIGSLSETIMIGPDFLRGEHPQFVVPSRTWQGSRVSKDGWSLIGTTMAPGFEYKDFELGERKTC